MADESIRLLKAAIIDKTRTSIDAVDGFLDGDADPIVK
jgi:hypothetical protein